MSDTPDNKKQSRLADGYRVVVYDEDTLGEVRSARVTGIGLLTALIMSFVAIALITSLLIAYTPIRYLIPGYADVTNNRAYMELNTKLDKIETELDAQRVYTNGLKNMLNPTQVKIDEKASSSEEIRNNSKFNENKGIASMNLSLEHYYFCSPLIGEISAKFDAESKHFGVDIVAEKDSPVKSILDGVVITSDWSARTGNTLSIQHGGNMISVYKHNSALLKKIGQTVKSGEAIAIIGNTGLHTNGPHVHFELWKDGQAVDPTNYINFN